MEVVVCVSGLLVSRPRFVSHLDLCTFYKVKIQNLPAESRCQSPDLPHLSMLLSAPFILSARLVSETLSEVFLILVNSFLLLIALFHVLRWAPKVSVLTVYMNDLFRRRGT